MVHTAHHQSSSLGIPFDSGSTSHNPNTQSSNQQIPVTQILRSNVGRPQRMAGPTGASPANQVQMSQNQAQSRTVQNDSQSND